MALDPRIPLQTQVGSTILDVGQVGQSFQNSLLALGQAKRASQAADRDAALQPLRQQLLQQQVTQGQQASVQQARQASLIAEARTAKDLVARLDAGDDIGVAGILGTNPHGVAPDTLAQADNLFRNAPDQFRAVLNDRIRAGQQLGAFGGASAEQKFIGTPQRITKKVDGEDQNFLVGVAQGPDGSFGLQEVRVEGEFVSTLGETAGEQTQRKIVESGGKEAAKLSAQFKLKPKVSAAVTLAVEGAKDQAAQAGEARSNALALNVYDTAMSGLVTALGGTLTGPVAGFLPAFTSNQQIANGAVAAMAPVLKQLFRSAGEGVFTDKDQELLTAMIPTRKDRAEARAAKLQNIDAIVRAKLSQPAQLPAQQQSAPQQTTVIQFDAQGNPI